MVWLSLVSLTLKKRESPSTKEAIFMDFKEAIEYVVWVKKTEERSKWTVRDYQKRVEEFARYMRSRGVYDTEKVEAKDVREFIESLENRGLSNTTINIKLRYIRAFFNLLEKEGMTNNVPMAGIKLRKERTDTIRPLSDQDVITLLKQIDQRKFLGKRNYVCTLIMLGTGIRPSELLGLYVDDWQEFHIIVRDEIAKDGKQRILPLSTGVVKELYKYVKIRGDWGGKWLFPCHEGGKFTTHGLYQALKKYAKKGGVDPKLIKPYAFRHTFAINYLRSGGDVFKLQKILGHSSLAMTRRYVQWSERDLSEGIDNVSPAEKFLKLTEKRKRRRG